VLPALSAHTGLDLRDDEALGFATAARALAEALELADWRYDARHGAVARYSAVGFEAAAPCSEALVRSNGQDLWMEIFRPCPRDVSRRRVVRCICRSSATR